MVTRFSCLISALGAFVKINIPTRGTTASEAKKCRGEVCVGL
jgi:hypothetical protein